VVRDKTQVLAKSGRIIAGTKAKIASSSKGLAGEYEQEYGTLRLRGCQAERGQYPDVTDNGHKSRDDAICAVSGGSCSTHLARPSTSYSVLLASRRHIIQNNWSKSGQTGVVLRPSTGQLAVCLENLEFEDDLTGLRIWLS